MSSTTEFPPALAEAFLSVWRQAMADRAKIVSVGGATFPVRRTPSRSLLQIDFDVEGQPYRALEQNPRTKSRWAQLARKGDKVMQFLSAGRYIAVVVSGTLMPYSSSRK